MSKRWLCLQSVLVLGLLWAVAGSWAWADDLDRQATWESMTVVEAREIAAQWLASQNPTTEQQRQLDLIWTEEDASFTGDLLGKMVVTIAIVESRARDLTTLVNRGITFSDQPDMSWLSEPGVDALVRHHLRFYVARALVQAQYFDEAQVLLKDIELDDVIDPASLLFYRGVVHHRLLNKEPGLKALDTLLERSDDIPERFRSLAQLMRGDLDQLKDDSLDHISRRMNDIQRRLDLGRANKKVRDVEDGVIESLDKLIEKLEEQQQQQQQQASASGQGSNRSSRPADTSAPMGGKGKGEVDKRRLGESSGWGKLPPKDREEAMQEIGRDFPPHYREVIEEYFKELAKKKEDR